MPVSEEDDATRRRAAVQMPPFVYRLVRLVAHAVNRVYWRVEVEGADKVPATGPVVLAPVHRSFMDFFVVSEVSRRKIFFMTKEEMWRSRLLGSFLDAVGAFPVHREGADRLAVDRAQVLQPEVLEQHLRLEDVLEALLDPVQRLEQRRPDQRRVHHPPGKQAGMKLRGRPRPGPRAHDDQRANPVRIAHGQ